jgi:molybdate transport system ATP-binding protein
MTISINLKKKLQYFDIDISCQCPDSSMLVMIGPSGGGKTTIIRMLAGLEQPDEGSIIYNNDIWFNSSAGIDISPQKRKLGYVFQDYTLFPHLSLFENAAFASKNKREVNDLFELFRITHLRNRKPSQVSGGERQRCAICQALARHPKILLLDEPFSALDAITRRGLREELRNMKGEFDFPVIYVTHDINEALYLADEIIPVVQGKIDESWISRMTERSDSVNRVLKAAREQKMSLAY